MRLWTDVGWVGGVSIWAQDYFGILQYGTTKSPGIPGQRTQNLAGQCLLSINVLVNYLGNPVKM